MTEELFSFRWGIPLLDEGDTRIPNFFFDHYTEAGITRQEFLTVLHLARYQFEKQDSECRPSIGTVARQMGYSNRGLQKVLAGLEKRGLLERNYRPGQTTIYDFSGFSRAVLKVELSTGGEPQFTPTPEPQFTPGVNPSSPKEEQEEEQSRTASAAFSEGEQQALDLLLTLPRMDPATARRLVKSCELAQVAGWVAEGRQADPDIAAALVVARLKAGEPAPTSTGGEGDPEDRRRFIGGEYADYIQH